MKMMLQLPRSLTCLLATPKRSPPGNCCTSLVACRCHAWTLESFRSFFLDLTMSFIACCCGKHNSRVFVLQQCGSAPCLCNELGAIAVYHL